MKKIFRNKKSLVISIFAVLAIGFAFYMFVLRHNVFVKGPDMKFARAGHSATLLHYGTVLISGGGGIKGKALNSAELYLPDKNKFIQISSMNRARGGHTATLLQDGRIFIVGGEDALHNPQSPTAEIYDPKTNKFSIVNGIKYNRLFHAASLLQDGRVLITGGSRFEPSYLHGRRLGSRSYNINEAEIYNPKTNKFKIVKMLYQAEHHQQITLMDGRVLIVSGDNRDGRDSGKPRNDLHAEIFDPITNKFIIIEQTKYKHTRGTATLLNDGRVLIVGGEDGIPISKVEIFDPKTNKFTVTDRLKISRETHNAILLKNGNVLIIGGLTGYGITIEIISSPEIYDVANNCFLNVNSKTKQKRKDATATLLNNGHVLITGGVRGPKKETEIYIP